LTVQGEGYVLILWLSTLSSFKCTRWRLCFNYLVFHSFKF